MQKKSTKPQNQRIKSLSISILVSSFIISGCAVSKKGRTEEELNPPSDSQKIENLSAALSRAQSRIEELDAKVSSMTDKLESTKLQLDNVTGNKPLKTQPVGDVAVAAVVPTKAAPKVVAEKEAAPAASDEGIESFRKAMQLFKSGKYSDAVLGFNRFTENHPDHILAGSAQFYAGESYYKLGEYKLALTEYEKVLTTFGSSPRVSSSIVRISQCQSALGMNKESMKMAALAKELFKGSPSLDLSAGAVEAHPAAAVSAGSAAVAHDLETKEVKKDAAELEPMGADEH